MNQKLGKSQNWTDNGAAGIIQASALLENDEDLFLCRALS